MSMDRMKGGKGIVAILVISLGFVLAAIYGWTERDFKQVVHVRYNNDADPNRVENLYWSKEPSTREGELGLNMTGKIHDGYLELHVKQEGGLETRIIPLNRVYNLVFFDPN